MKIVSVVGARPQFIKAAPMSRAIRRKHVELLVHTGQHYDHSMSQVFFQELDIPKPAINLGVGSGSHGWQTGQMLVRLESVLLSEKPDWLLVYGDTNSTLAGALAAAKLGIKVAHVEAGLRSFNRSMPEEVNRVLTDHVSDLLFCPSQTAAANLASEGIVRGVRVVGDVMADALAYYAKQARMTSNVLARLGLVRGNYFVATVHRAENTDSPMRLSAIMRALDALQRTVVFPAHPRTRKFLSEFGYSPSRNVLLIEPLGYLDMIRLEEGACAILTDSGGVQKEAYWLGVPCVTLREETEWVETVQCGWNVLAGVDPERIVQAARSFVPPKTRPVLYGDGRAADRCVFALEETL